MKGWYIILFAVMVIISPGCTSSDKQEAAPEEAVIPEIELDEKDPTLKLARNGMLLINDSIPYSGYLTTHYQSGGVSSRRSYLNGRLEGKWLTYFEDGAIQSIRPYTKGEKNGVHLGFYPDGIKKFQYYFEKGFGEGTHHTWHPNGLMASEQNYVDGREFGAQKAWRPDGKMRSNYVVKENGRKYGMVGLRRCTKVDGETGNIDPYTGS